MGGVKCCYIAVAGSVGVVLQRRGCLGELLGEGHI